MTTPTTPTTREMWIVKTAINNVLCEDGETRWAGIVGGATGYRVRLFARLATAEKWAQRWAAVGGRVEAREV